VAQGWRVVHQRQTTDITPDGRFADVVEVSAVTTAGTGFTVRVPLDRYTVEVVRDALEARYEQIVAVEGL
jgi:hypothetical protein